MSAHAIAHPASATTWAFGNDLLLLGRPRFAGLDVEDVAHVVAGHVETIGKEAPCDRAPREIVRVKKVGAKGVEYFKMFWSRLGKQA